MVVETAIADQGEAARVEKMRSRLVEAVVLQVTDGGPNERAS